ncbi:hypothetical protein OIPHN330_16280 [Citrobacter freundii]|nr:hypothetical protein OIPHN330_16280 [Citrobacter freundii]BEJ38914.1 hypothetical protein OIPHN354_16260 [Citrobacter freundii]
MTALNKQALLIENGQLVADTLRHLANNEIDSDYFAITSTNENGTEIDHELVITDYALQAAGTVDELVMALESAEKRIAELEARTAVVKHFDEFQIVHYGGSEDYAKGYIDCQNNYNKALAAAGIGVKGE